MFVFQFVVRLEVIANSAKWPVVCCIFWELDFPERATHTQRSPDRGLEEPDGLVKSVAMKGFPGVGGGSGGWLALMRKSVVTS